MDYNIFEYNRKNIPHWARELSRVATQTWSDTFIGRGYYTAEIVRGYTDNAFSIAKTTEELTDESGHFFMVQNGDDVIGYAKLEERSVEPCISTTMPLYLARFYLDRSAHGTGVAKKLLDAVCAKTLELGYQSIWLSVWEPNIPAVKFYLKHGFKKDGEWEYPLTSNGTHYVDIDWLMSFTVPSS